MEMQAAHRQGVILAQHVPARLLPPLSSFLVSAGMGKLLADACNCSQPQLIPAYASHVVHIAAGLFSLSPCWKQFVKMPALTHGPSTIPLAPVPPPCGARMGGGAWMGAAAGVGGKCQRQGPVPCFPPTSFPALTPASMGGDGGGDICPPPPPFQPQISTSCWAGLSAAPASSLWDDFLCLACCRQLGG